MNKIETPILFQLTKFLTSAANYKQLAPDEGAEIAFVGRSNAGKSSALNILCQQKKLARISKTPGRTQLLNFFEIDEKHRLVDLPGYGFAKVPPAIKRRWNHELDRYLRTRQSLRGIVLLMDIRHPLKPFDEHIIQWALSANLPVHILLTKADKLKSGARKATFLKTKKTLNTQTLISIQLFSATENIGRDEFKSTMMQWLNGALRNLP